ncbi:MAG TPA: metallophosphoesterase [Kiritimatiellia bacterium]|nr:metallophosphoesterase [Kiritimatiellia bacterium]HRZ12562.1 metallophosphoesterase [Kiritimatiellia bacterium]HSA17640.1 metallophosphoesterase [Kiritimatiellia bacterium]
MGVLAARAEVPFSLIILPDTQYYTDSTTNRSAMFSAQTDWILANRTNLNIRFVLHEGDITEHTYSYRGTNTLEWQRASQCMAPLDGKVPYLVTYGNHDFFYNAGIFSRNTDRFNEYFPLSRFQATASVVDSFPAGRSDNIGAVFTAGGVDWLVVSLEWGPGDATLAWADQLLNRYPRHRAIVLTHSYLYLDGLWQGRLASHNSDPHEGYGPVNNGLEMWDKFVRKHSNIAFVFNGHAATSPWETGARRVDQGDFSNTVHAVVANYQMMTNGGAGYLRILQFTPDTGRLNVTTYSPHLGNYKTDTNNQFACTNRALFDASPPGSPSGLRVEAVDGSTCRLTWEPAADGESGLLGYAVFRDTQQVAFVQGAECTDWSAPPDTLCSYRVVAINGAGCWSEGAASAVVVTPREVRAPAVDNVWAAASNEVRVSFDKAVDSRDAMAPTNYSFGEALALEGVTLAPGAREVILTTEPMEDGSCYPLLIKGWESHHPDGDRSAGEWLFDHSTPVLQEGFADGDLAGWAAMDEGTLNAPSLWSVQSNRVKQASFIGGPAWNSLFNRQGAFLLWTAEVAAAWSDYAMEADITTGYGGGIGLVFRYQNPSNYYRFEMDQTNRCRRLYRQRNGTNEMLAWNWHGYTVNSNQHIRIEVLADTVRVFVNGADVFGRTIVDALPLASGTVGLWTWRSRPTWFDNITVRPIQIAASTAEYNRYILEYWDEAGNGWQGRGGGKPRPSLNPHADADGDGMTNYKEYVSMTHPMNRDSVFRVSLVATNPGRVSISFPSSTNRLYRVYARRTSTGGTWWPLQSAAFRGDPVQTMREDLLRSSPPPLMPADRRYYRVDVQRPR